MKDRKKLLETVASTTRQGGRDSLVLAALDLDTFIHSALQSTVAVLMPVREPPILKAGAEAISLLPGAALETIASASPSAHVCQGSHQYTCLPVQC